MTKIYPDTQSAHAGCDCDGGRAGRGGAEVTVSTAIHAVSVVSAVLIDIAASLDDTV